MHPARGQVAPSGNEDTVLHGHRLTVGKRGTASPSFFVRERRRAREAGRRGGRAAPDLREEKRLWDTESSTGWGRPRASVEQPSAMSQARTCAAAWGRRSRLPRSVHPRSDA